MAQDIIKKNIPLILDINARKGQNGTLIFTFYQKILATGQV